MIGQSIINIKSVGARGFMLCCRGIAADHGVFLGDYLSLIPMAALVAVMIMVFIGTFQLGLDFETSGQYRCSTNIVMVATGDLWLVGHRTNPGLRRIRCVLLAAMFFATR